MASTRSCQPGLYFAGDAGACAGSSPLSHRERSPQRPDLPFVLQRGGGSGEIHGLWAGPSKRPSGLAMATGRYPARKHPHPRRKVEHRTEPSAYTHPRNVLNSADQVVLRRTYQTNAAGALARVARALPSASLGVVVDKPAVSEIFVSCCVYRCTTGLSPTWAARRCVNSSARAWVEVVLPESSWVFAGW